MLPLSALVGTAVADHARTVAVEQSLDRRSVVATLLEDPEPTSMLPGEAASATVTWTTPTGAENRTKAEVSRTAVRGSQVTVWTSPKGNLTTPPLAFSQVEARAAAAAVGAQLTAMGLVWIAFACVRRGVDRRRCRPGARSGRAYVEPRGLSSRPDTGQFASPVPAGLPFAAAVQPAR